jgi:hypothetical protein
MKNKVTATAFLKWYFSERQDTYDIGKRVIESLMNEGVFFISELILFENCGYIPQHICEDKNGNEEYNPSDVEFIQD